MGRLLVLARIMHMAWNTLRRRAQVRAAGRPVERLIFGRLGAVFWGFRIRIAAGYRRRVGEQERKKKENGG